MFKRIKRQTKANDCDFADYEKIVVERDNLRAVIDEQELLINQDSLIKLKEDKKKLEDRLNSIEKGNDDQDLLDIVKDYYLSLFSRQVVKANQEKYFEYSIGGLSLIILANGLTQILTSNDKPFIRKNINRFSGTITLLGATVLSSRVVRRLI